MSRVRCPNCGAEIELEARKVQGELPLGPIGLRSQKKLDKISRESVQSNESIRPTSIPIQPPARRDSVPDSNRIDCDESEIANRIAPGGEDESLIESIREVVGQVEWSLNGSGWKWRERHHYRALVCALQDWRALTPHEKAKIDNRAAWLTDRFKRAQRAQRKTA